MSGICRGFVGKCRGFESPLHPANQGRTKERNDCNHRTQRHRPQRCNRPPAIPATGISDKADPDHEGVLFLHKPGRTNSLGVGLQRIWASTPYPYRSSPRLAHQGREETLRTGLKCSTPSSTPTTWPAPGQRAPPVLALPSSLALPSPCWPQRAVRPTLASVF